MKTIVTIENGKVTIETDDGVEIVPMPGPSKPLTLKSIDHAFNKISENNGNKVFNLPEKTPMNPAPAGGVVPKKDPVILEPARAAGVKSVPAKKCRDCGDTFVGTSNNQRSCAACIEKRDGAPVKKGICENCRDEFERKGRGSGRARLCAKCRDKGVQAPVKSWCAICHATRPVGHTVHDMKDAGKKPPEYKPQPADKPEKEPEVPRKKAAPVVDHGPFCIHCQDYVGHGTPDHPDNLPMTQKVKDMQPIKPSDHTHDEPKESEFDDRWNCQACRDKGEICQFHHKMENSGYKPPRRFN